MIFRSICMPEDSFVRFEGQDISNTFRFSNKFTDSNQIEFLAHTAAEEDIQLLGGPRKN